MAGPVAATAAYLPVRDSVDPSLLAIALLVIILAAAVHGGRWPAIGAAVLSFLALDLHHEPRTGWARLDLPEVELQGTFVLAVAIVITLVHRGAQRHERRLRAEFRWARLDRVLELVAAGAPNSLLLAMVERELDEEFDLDLSRYESTPRTTCDYRVGRHGGLFRAGERVAEAQLHMPAEPVAIPVEHMRRPLGQLVLVPRGAGQLDEDQLLLAAQLAGALGEALDGEHAEPST